MTTFPSNPGTPNYLPKCGFRFILKRSPNLNFFMQEAEIPDLTLPPLKQSTPFADILIPGEQALFGELSVNFVVDEGLNNYLELYDWITDLGRPNDGEGFRKLSKQPRNSGEGIYSDITLSILNANYNPRFNITYFDAFPIFLGKLRFSTLDSSIEYQTCSASFQYTTFDIEKINA